MNESSAIQRRLKSLFSGSSFASHVAAVSGSVFISQALSVIVGPINSRLYKPSDYGTLTIFGAISSLMCILGTMQYEMSLATADDDTEGVNLLLLCLILIGSWVTLFALASFLAPRFVSQLITKDNTQVLHYMWFLPYGILTASLGQLFQRWGMRKRVFPKLSKIAIIAGILASMVTVPLGFMHAGLPGLITASIVSSAFNITALGRLAWPDIRAQWHNVSRKGIVAAARRYYRYPLYTTWATLMQTFSNLIPIFFLTKGFGSAYTGYFSLTQRILFLPILLISGAITPVFYSRAKQAQMDGTLTALTLRLVNTISGINVFFSVFLGFFGSWIFVWAFGPQWHRAGQYVVALAPWVLCNFLVNPLEALPLVFDRQRTSFFFQASLMVLRAGSLAVGIHLKNDLLAMWLFGATSAIYMLVYFSWMLSLVKGPVLKTLLGLGKELVLCLTVFGFCRWIMALSHNNLWITGLVLVPALGFFSYRGVRQLLLGRANP